MVNVNDGEVVVVVVTVDVGAASHCLHEVEVADDGAAAAAVFADADDADADGIEKVKPIFESQEFCIGSRNRSGQLLSASEVRYHAPTPPPPPTFRSRDPLVTMSNHGFNSK